MPALRRPRSPRLLLPALAASLALAGPARAWDVTDWLSVGALTASAGQCQLFVQSAGNGDVCRATILTQPYVEIRPWEGGRVFGQAGFAAGNLLDDVSPFALRSWGADLEDGVTDINGRWDYLLRAFYEHTFRLADDVTFAVAGGVIDATEYLQGNRFAEDEYTQFMNQTFVNAANALLPSYDLGGAFRLDAGPWSARLVVMEIGENDDGRSAAFVGGQLGYRLETALGEGNYRLVLDGTSRDFRDPGGGSLEHFASVSVSIDQDLGDTFGAFLRLSVISTKPAVAFEGVYTGGLHVRGAAWGRPEDDVGLAYGFLDGGNQQVQRSHVAEAYYRLVLFERLGITADVQYLRDELRRQRNPAGFAIGLRIALEL